MRVRVKLFATLRRFAENVAPGIPFEVEMDEAATLLALLNQLKIPVEEEKITFVNGIIQDLEYEIKTGDEIGIFPPIGGG
jgi:molybdopterin converting factor small subunit